MHAPGKSQSHYFSLTNKRLLTKVNKCWHFPLVDFADRVGDRLCPHPHLHLPGPVVCHLLPVAVRVHKRACDWLHCLYLDCGPALGWVCSITNQSPRNHYRPLRMQTSPSYSHWPRKSQSSCVTALNCSHSVRPTGTRRPRNTFISPGPSSCTCKWFIYTT